MRAKKRKWWKWALGSLVVISAFNVSVYFGVTYLIGQKFYPEVPAANYPAPENLAEAQAQDLDYFAHYFDLERSYTPQALADAMALVETMKTRAGDFTAAEFDLGIGEVVALADNGHSNVYASGRARRFGRVDIRTLWFEDGLYVLRATDENRDILGARLVSIGGVQAEDILKAFGKYYGGAPNFKRGMSAYFFEAPQVLEAAHFGIKASEAVYRFEKSGGEIIEKLLPYGEPDPDGIPAFPWDWMYPAPMKGEAENWHPAFDTSATDLPLYLQHSELAFIKRPLPQLDAYYIQLRQNYDSDNQSIKNFLKAALAEIEEIKPKHLILDVRFNGGGDYTTTAKHMWKLPTLLPDDGRIFVISSNATFSAGMSSMGFVKDAGGDMVTIIGTEPGDRMQFWSEGSYMTLPNSQASFRFSTGYVDMQNKCDDYAKCYWIGAFYPIEVDSLSPDVHIPTTYADYARGQDPVMNWIEQEISQE